MIRLTTITLILSLAYIPFAAADIDAELGPCEDALQLLVTKLEVSGKFNDANRVDALPPANSGYSPCFISADDVSDSDAKTYFVYRHSDNVTIFVYRAPVISSTFVWYGPFFSAYRK